jgi:hypothetical protein
MRAASTLLMLGLLGCTKGGATSDPVAVGPGARPPTQAELTIAITSVTLASDCGAGPSEAAAESQIERKRARDSDGDAEYAESAKRACEQTSMQLSVTGAVSGAPVQLRVKKVELLDDKGNLIGELVPRTPTIWSQGGTYRPWDQMVGPANELSVSYALSEPPWGAVNNRFNRTYVLRAVLTIGATDRTVQRDVHLSEPATLGPDVDT